MPTPTPRVIVEVPRDENLRLGRVGIVAILGFAVGVLWPTLAGVRLVPMPPGVSEAATNEGAPSSGAEAPPAAVTGPGPVISPVGLLRVNVGEAEVLYCRDAQGRKHRRCDVIEHDAHVRTALQKLGECPGLENAEGSLVLQFELDLNERRVADVQAGKGATLPPKAIEALLACTKRDLSALTFDKIEHRNSAYGLAYALQISQGRLGAEAAGAASTEGPIVSMNETASVVWELALVRSTPSRQGQVVERLPHGSKISVTGKQGDWCRIKYDAKGSSGWVFHSSVGL